MEDKRIRVRYPNGFVTEYREEIAKRLLARKSVVLAEVKKPKDEGKGGEGGGK